MEENFPVVRGNASTNCASLSSYLPDSFNNPPDGWTPQMVTRRKVRILRELLNLIAIVKEVKIDGVEGLCKPYRTFNRETNTDYFFVKVETDAEENHPWIATKKRSDGEWIDGVKIPLENVTSIEMKTVPIDEAHFVLIINTGK